MNLVREVGHPMKTRMNGNFANMQEVRGMVMVLAVEVVVAVELEAAGGTALVLLVDGMIHHLAHNVLIQEIVVV